ncbi:hypothetical protein V6N13_032871 [Hibiscus sabdariffa]
MVDASRRLNIDHEGLVSRIETIEMLHYIFRTERQCTSENRPESSFTKLIVEILGDVLQLYIRVRSSMEPLGSFLPAINALLQLRVSILDVSIPGLGIDTQKPYWNPGICFAHNRVSILKGGYRYSIGVSVLKNHSGILESFKNVTGYRYSRLGIDTHLGYQYSIGVSVLKNHSGILECFKNVPGYRYSYEGIGTLCKNCIPTYVFYKGYRYPKAGIDTQMPGRQF